MRRFLLPLALLVVASFASKANATIFFGLSTDPATPPTTQDVLNITANVGDTISLSVFLVETADDTRMFDNGMVRAAYFFDYDNSLVDVSNPQASASDPDFDSDPPQFSNDLGLLFASGIARFVPSSPFDPGGTFPFGDGSKSVLLTTFDVTVKGFGDVGSFTDPNPDANFVDTAIFSNPAVSVDDEVYSPVGTSALRINPVAVPEPSSLVLLGGACGLMCLRRRRRR